MHDVVDDVDLLPVLLLVLLALPILLLFVDKFRYNMDDAFVVLLLVRV